MAKVAIIRFSAIGDVAMTIPVIHSLATQHPEHEFLMLSRKILAPLFSYMPANVKFFGIDFSQKEYQGISGLQNLFGQLRKMQIDYVADLHDVLRSRYLRFRFRLSGIPVKVIDKGRVGKRKLVRRYCKVFQKQKSSFERYADVFKDLGFSFRLDFHSLFGKEKGNVSSIQKITGEEKGYQWIGIAPFAKHTGKIYPINLQEEVVAHFSSMPDKKIFLFGGGKNEQNVFEEWASKYPSVVSLAGKITLNEELALMSRLQVMVSMDSANMHLASLVGTPVVSIWGATHPYAGFMGWGQSEKNAVQIGLPCRPCSVYGEKPCFRKDYACLNEIKLQQVIEKINTFLNK